MPSVTAKDASGTTQTLQTLPAVGQAVMASSLPVAIASDQAALPVTVSGVATAANQTTANTSLASVATNTTVSSTIATGQISVTTTATLIVAARTGRKSVTIIQEGTTLVRMGTSGVILTTGVPLPGTAYSAFTFEGGAAIYGIVASGTQTVSYVENF